MNIHEQYTDSNRPATISYRTSARQKELLWLLLTQMVLEVTLGLSFYAT